MDGKIIIGLTGQTCSGKSTVSKIFEENGFYIIDADKVAREIAELSEVLEAIVEHFGERYVVDGHLDRKALGRLVFANRDKLDILNQIMHPAICNRMMEMAAKCEERYVLFDAPQLFESGLNKKCDKIVAVVADNSVIMRRLLRRDKLTITEAENRLKSQLSKQFFIDNSDYIIYSEYDSYETTKTTSIRVLQKIRDDFSE